MLQIIPDVAAQKITVIGEKFTKVAITDVNGKNVKCDPIEQRHGFAVLRADNLKMWSPDNPVCYIVKTDEGSERFGYSQLTTSGNSQVLLNGHPIFLRGYIRGIVAHEHPNMTGKNLKDAAIKNISQAKKYGFNLVRFHSTIPTLEFVEAADELGLLIHVEIGFAYERDKKGNKKHLAMNNNAWTDTICKYRNHPSIAIFCIGNEMHNSGHYPEVMKLYQEGKKLAPNKLIMDNSGWGEYDRASADIFSQHIAYYFPFKHHADMFETDACWRLNGSATDEPLDVVKQTSNTSAKIRREATPRRPVLAHEAIHYIEIPDYEKLNKKFDDFATKVGKKYLEENGIKKPKFMTTIPELIKQKGLEGKMRDYMMASQEFKKLGIKRYLETLRFSQLCGFEMLQFADCLKYENKNGIVDCFDDDKYIDNAWMKSFNDDSALLAKFKDENFYETETVRAEFFLSHFANVAEKPGTLTISLHDGDKKEMLYVGKNFYPVNGLQKLCEMDLSFNATGKSRIITIVAEFKSEVLNLSNSWEITLFSRIELKMLPDLELSNSESLQKLISRRAENMSCNANYLVTDRLEPTIFNKLRAGKTVLLLYHRDDEGNSYYLPGALERFKPCIWDRGSNLGGVWANSSLRQVMGGKHYFGLSAQPLLEGGYKLNLDTFPNKAMDELVFGVDKPVRDRMKGLVHGIKAFCPEDTLRDFCHVGALKVGKGKLVICTMNRQHCDNPAVAEFFITLINMLPHLRIKSELSETVLKKYLKKVSTEPRQKEDVMNHFWEIDNKPVEDSLFWEECNLDLTKIK